VREEDCGHAPPWAYHIVGRDPQTGQKLGIVSYCVDCSPLAKECLEAVAFDQAQQSIPDTIEPPR
jgi:hypothetical protein